MGKHSSRLGTQISQYTNKDLEGVEDEKPDIGVAGLKRPQQRHRQLVREGGGEQAVGFPVGERNKHVLET